ncbi:polysaccharide lyase family 14 protein [Laccaria amethystina LaAM-08-1]|uniref:Polysaccharide lyase family 14 protein n=1 Tax=Laccaria amethystina LaAM-08-1 TaxID=1095629 RepID=A0A0C9WTA1_9AGAR|nr:polysaccharide lyase family 14 protein [Laccaria amethystina LaAM-08-1]
MALMVIFPLLTFAEILSTLAAPASAPSTLSSPYNDPLLVAAVDSLLISPASHSPAFILPLSSQSEEPTETVTITISAPPTTVTDTITLSTPTSTPSPPADPGFDPEPEDTQWSAPPSMPDLTPFKISSFPGSKTNLQILTGIPAQASALPSPQSLTLNDILEWDNSTSVIQAFYPANSINPAQDPQGGAQFYASPLPVSRARNVSLSYNVFFPVDFAWALAGKLPGIYGGHTACSGGDEALDCFSTRLMWREGGLGELYLYAPKDKQTPALCADSQSTCDSAYGLSIGRGSFTWAAGGWTSVTQTVYLNTPGQQDGQFTLDVNGERVIERNDVFYRDVPLGGDPATGDGDGYLDPALSGLWEVHEGVLGDAVHTDQHEWSLKDTLQTGPTKTGTPLQQALEVEPIGFIGIFFSTFFGGHEAKYATPTDQYVWFNGFTMSNNDVLA